MAINTSTAAAAIALIVAGIFAWATLPASVEYNALMVEAGLSVAGLCDNRLPDLQAANTD